MTPEFTFNWAGVFALAFVCSLMINGILLYRLKSESQEISFKGTTRKGGSTSTAICTEPKCIDDEEHMKHQDWDKSDWV